MNIFETEIEYKIFQGINSDKLKYRSINFLLGHVDIHTYKCVCTQLGWKYISNRGWQFRNFKSLFLEVKQAERIN